MTNQYKPFGTAADPALTLTAEEYDADAQRLTGNQLGPARPELVNAVLRQTSVVVAAVAGALEALDGNDVDDDGDVDALASRLAGAFGGGGLGFAFYEGFDADVSGEATVAASGGVTAIVQADGGGELGEVHLAEAYAGPRHGVFTIWNRNTVTPVNVFQGAGIGTQVGGTIQPGKVGHFYNSLAGGVGAEFNELSPSVATTGQFPADATGVAVTATLPEGSALYGAAIVLERGTTSEGNHAVVMATPLQSLPLAVSNLNLGLLGVEAPAWAHGLLAWNTPIRWITWTADGSGGVSVPSSTQVYLAAPVRDSAGVYAVAFGTQFVGPTQYSISVDIEGGAGYGWEASGKSGTGFTLTFRDLATMAAADPPSGMVTVRVWPVSTPHLPTMLP